MTTPPQGVPEADPIATRLKASRLDLLDLSLRNPLLNYRPSVRRGLDIIDETSAQVFSFLFAEGGSLRFHPTKKSDDAAKDGDLFFLENESPGPAAVGVGQDNPPNSLATPYTREFLESRLLCTYADAKLMLQEQGVNTLFLVLGMLQWKEADDAAELRYAPLVLVPVALDRKSARSLWQLSAQEEEAGLNLSLVEKLKEFGIRLPADPPLHTVEDLAKLTAQVEEAIAEKKGWAVARDRMALGFFSFGKFLMYKDLEAEAWPDEC